MGLNKILVRRIGMSLCGVIICAIAVGFFKMAAFGVDPFQSLMSGLDQLIPIPFGTLYVIVNGVLLVFSLIFNRHNIGIATFINLFLLGYITQFTLETLQAWIPAPGIGLRILFLVIGIVVLCIGSAGVGASALAAKRAEKAADAADAAEKAPAADAETVTG